MLSETKEYTFFIAIIVLLLVILLAQYRSKHVMTDVRTRQITNIDIYECTRKALDKHHAELISTNTITSGNKKYLRVHVKDTSNKKWSVECDLISHNILGDNQD